MSWRKVKLAEFLDEGGIDLQTGPFGTQLKASDYTSEGTPVINVRNVGYGNLRSAKLEFVPDEVVSNLSRHLLEKQDIVFGRKGAVDRHLFVSDSEAGWMQGSDCIRLRVLTDTIHPAFLSFALRLPSHKRWMIAQCSNKATMASLNQDVIARIPFNLPDHATQARIASILSAYDDLIENNRRRIQLLEQAARLLYKEWFVYLRFPGHEHVTITEGVPEGWERKPLGDVLVELESGGRPKGGAREEGIPSIGAENVIGIGQYDFTKEKYVPEEYFNAMRKGVVQSRDVVVYKDGANIGRSSYFGDGFPHERCAVNEHVFILRALPELGQNLLYFWIAHDETRQHIVNLNANTAQPGVSQRNLKTLSFIQPQQAISHLFNQTVEPIVRQIFLLAKEVQALSQARDLLLPRLMNGELAA